MLGSLAQWSWSLHLWFLWSILWVQCYGSLCRWAAVCPLTWPRFFRPLKAQLSQLAMVRGPFWNPVLLWRMTGQLFWIFLSGMHVFLSLLTKKGSPPFVLERVRLSLLVSDGYPFTVTFGPSQKKKIKNHLYSHFPDKTYFDASTTTSCYSVFISMSINKEYRINFWTLFDI